ncbi:MAG: hypothetical protein P9L97_09160 [Candidatus Tenebribacter davisii]|nr:hypothetical protein [Candidatus Tenebribacter davisii]
MDTMYHVMSLPNHILMKIFIYGGLDWKSYYIWCLGCHFGYCDQDSYNAVVFEEMKNEQIAKMINLNRQRLLNKSKPNITKKIRLMFNNTEIVGNILETLPQVFTIKDPGKWKMPPALDYFLKNHRMRIFVESGLLINLTFFNINRYWLQFNPVGIRRDYFDAYRYLIWDTKSMSIPELRYFFLRNAANQFYSTHNKVLSKGVDAFLGCWGLQNRDTQLKSINKIALQVSKKINNTSEGVPKEYFSLIQLCTTEMSHNHNRQLKIKSKSTQFPGNLVPEKFSDSNPSARHIRDMNREYRFKQLLDFNMNRRGE